MSRLHFGTDGARGVANEKLTPELAMALAQGAGRWLTNSGQPRAVIVGMDTRKSGPMLEAAVCAGFASVGVDSVCLGVAPTPLVSFAARTGDFGLGVIISASHNPAPQNGIKFVGHDGRKLPDEVEEEIEGLMKDPAARPTGAGIGTIARDTTPVFAYLDMLGRIVPESLVGLEIAMDGANGAAYSVAQEVLLRLGANLVVMGVTPDGMNINAKCGATHPEAIRKFTVESGSKIGVAFDGDADRCIFSDETGRLINGDRTIAMWALRQKELGRLTPGVVVGTVMSNGGFERYVSSHGIKLERTKVGDKHVAARMTELGARIGGEQSGHIIFPDHGPTGDGLATMLEILNIIQTAHRPAASYVDDFAMDPQILVNLKIADRETWDSGARVQAALESAKTRLAGRGRVNVRPSGTEDKLRVMVEAESYELRDEVVGSLLAALQDEAGGTVLSQVDLTNDLGD